MFIVITAVGILLSVLFAPHSTKPMKAVFTPPGFEQPTPGNVLDRTVNNK